MQAIHLFLKNKQIRYVVILTISYIYIQFFQLYVQDVVHQPYQLLGVNVGGKESATGVI